jgi:chorismate mutase
MKKIGINLEKTILKEIKEIITHPLIEESKIQWSNSSDLSLPVTSQVAAQFPAQHLLFTN